MIRVDWLSDTWHIGGFNILIGGLIISNHLNIKFKLES